MKISLPWVPPTLNQYSRMHWSQQRKATRTAAAWIRSSAYADVTPEKTRVTIQQYRRNPVDHDGLVGGCKPVFDALVRLRFAKDDSDKHMEQVVLPVIVDRHPRTEITIEEI